LITEMHPQISLQERQLSAYVHHHQVAPQVMAVYTPVEHTVTFLPLNLWENLRHHRLTDIPPAIIQDLAARNFLVPPDFDQVMLNHWAGPPIPGFFSLFLIVSEKCNMGCSYCVVDHSSDGPDEPRNMPLEVAEAAIQLFSRHLNKYRPPVAKITFYGGEPLLNKDLLHKVIPYIRSLRYQGQQGPVEILCFSNGLNFDPALAEVFRRYDVVVGLSLDGARQHHDQARRTAHGQETFDRIIKNYWRYRQSGVKLGVSCTIGKHNVADLTEIVRFFVEDLHIPALQLQSPIQTSDRNNPLYLNLKDIARPALDAFRYLRSRGVEEGLALRRIQPFTQGRFHHRDCFAVGGELTVLPDGRLGPCHNAAVGGERYFSGNVLDPDAAPETESTFMEWHARMPLNMASCQRCSFIGLCGGGCPYNALLTQGSIWQVDPQHCAYMEEFLNWLLEDVWERYATGAGFAGLEPFPLSAAGGRPYG